MAGLDCILSKLELPSNSLSPEWGGGGVYGLLYHRGTLYYTLAFEAIAFFHHDDCETRIYRFEHIGKPPRSGGDTYNASVAVDGTIYFGGWVHAPTDVLHTADGRSVISFTNKYSHVHAYDTGERSVKLLWLEGGGDKRQWAGEVTDLLYNPSTDTLLAARGDGHFNLGVYEIDRRRGAARRASGKRVLRGTIYMDYACFTLHHGWGGRPGLHCINLDNYSQTVTVELDPVETYSVDGGGLWGYRSGDIEAAYTKLYAAVKGGIIVFDPFGNEHVFVRMMDFHYNTYGPLRSNILPLAGGLLVAFSAQSHATVRGTDELPEVQQKASQRPVAPSILVYISPPTARIVAALGVRITSMTLMGSKVLIAGNTVPNLERYDATRIDYSRKSIVAFDAGRLLTNPPPPLVIELEGWIVDNKQFAGIPLTGYRYAELEVKTNKTNRITVYTYTLNTPPGNADTDTYTLHPGKTRIDLTTHRSLITSMRLEAPDPKARIRIILEP
ncbi:DUF2139 domain-containing protein [Hyperthermus butylicus]|uniref:Conserved uncharacterized archaeal protein n=1 Tax=Hyperthermus butylicus (strain DSM 5456 / JCM 9403 / PLM1-5) TaxID=415426 RepID=A2BKH0_HYPBU|nr:DUF2139 domain-containing protein [Hyperthermus butylicus]ABM80481.1 conserved uncharacterized archaeal protein [Hyperthermus butylicus DSM 5456]